MGTIYDSLDDVTKALADVIAETRGLDKNLSAIAAKAGEGADEVIANALNVARASGDPDKNMQMAARIKILDGELEGLNARYKTAVEVNNVTDLIPLKNQISVRDRERAALTEAIALAKVAGGE
jgi:hypothetical protein